MDCRNIVLGFWWIILLLDCNRFDKRIARSIHIYRGWMSTTGNCCLWHCVHISFSRFFANNIILFILRFLVQWNVFGAQEVFDLQIQQHKDQECQVHHKAFHLLVNQWPTIQIHKIKFHWKFSPKKISSIKCVIHFIYVLFIIKFIFRFIMFFFI